MREPKAKVIYRNIAELNELENNPRAIRKDDFERLKTSIANNADYFEARPCILSNRTGKLVVIAGNQRLKAARALGLQEIPTILLEGLDEQRERELVIRDNVENGEWDYDMLANEWESADLDDWGLTTLPMESHVDVDDFFEQAEGGASESEPKKITCPHCGKEIIL